MLRLTAVHIRMGCRMIAAAANFCCLKIIRLTPFDKVIDKNRPCTLCIIVCHVIVDVRRKIQQ